MSLDSSNLIHVAVSQVLCNNLCTAVAVSLARQPALTQGLHAASTGITRHVCFTKLNVPPKDLASEGVKRNKTLVSEADLPEGLIAPPQKEGARTLYEPKSGQLHYSFVTPHIRQVNLVGVPASTAYLEVCFCPRFCLAVKSCCDLTELGSMHGD